MKYSVPHSEQPPRRISGAAKGGAPSKMMRPLKDIGNGATDQRPWVFRLSQEPRQFSSERRLIGELALPDDKDAPALAPQPPGILLVALAVPFELGDPIIKAGFWAMRTPARSVWVPVAPEYLDDFPKAREDHVGTTGENPDVEPVAIAHLVNQPAHGHLG